MSCGKPGYLPLLNTCKLLWTREVILQTIAALSPTKKNQHLESNIWCRLQRPMSYTPWSHVTIPQAPGGEGRWDHITIKRPWVAILWKPYPPPKTTLTHIPGIWFSRCRIQITVIEDLFSLMCTPGQKRSLSYTTVGSLASTYFTPNFCNFYFCMIKFQVLGSCLKIQGYFCLFILAARLGGIRSNPEG